MKASETGNVSSGTALRVFGRSLFIQAGFNPEGMQNLGFVYALLPALLELYPDPEKQSDAVKRHLAAFNTHPYVAAAIIGGVLFHEERIARGEEPPEASQRFKDSLMGPLAALGDGFFWLSLRPAVGAFSAALVPLIGAWAGLVFLVLYNTVHLIARARLFRLGWKYGEGLVTEVSKAHLPIWGERLRSVAAACAGGLAAFLSILFGAHQGGMAAPVLAGGCLLLGAMAWLWVTRGKSPYVVLYFAALLSAALGAAL